MTKITLSAKQIARIIDGTIVSEVSPPANKQILTGIASLEDATHEQVSFLGNAKYFDEFIKTKAGLVIVPPNLPKTPKGPTLVEVDNPSHAFGLLVREFAATQKTFHPGISPDAYLHPSVKLDKTQVAVGPKAVLEEGVSIGNGSDIAPNSYIGKFAKIGKNVKIYPGAVVREFCEVGDHSILQPGCIIGSDGFGYEFIDGQHQKIDQIGNVIIGHDCEIGANTTIDRARFGTTRIGHGCKIDNLVQIAHNVKIGNHTIIIAQAGIAGSTHIGNYCVIAAQAGIAGHLKITDKVTLAGRTGVASDITEPDTTWWGTPATPINHERRKVIALDRLPDLLKRVQKLEQQLAKLAPPQK